MWYDLRWGHQTVWGDAKFLPGLTRFTADRITPSSALDLLVNRGTLLVINDEIAARPDMSEAARRAIIRHAVKAILGYGDALLYFLGAYHWSYRERAHRMSARTDVAPDFIELYENAIEFRFSPNYAIFDGKGEVEWLDGIRMAVEVVHLRVESQRLGVRDLTWDNYLSVVLDKSLVSTVSDPLEMARRSKAVVRKLSRRNDGVMSGKIGSLRPDLMIAWRLTPPRDQLAILFPVIAYDLSRGSLHSAAVATFGRVGRGPLRAAFLRAWGIHKDPNFAQAARVLGLDGTGPGAVLPRHFCIRLYEGTPSRPVQKTKRGSRHRPRTAGRPQTARFEQVFAHLIGKHRQNNLIHHGKRLQIRHE